MSSEGDNAMQKLVVRASGLVVYDNPTSTHTPVDDLMIQSRTACGDLVSSVGSPRPWFWGEGVEGKANSGSDKKSSKERAKKTSDSKRTAHRC
jgi:hypothetical protein